MAIVLNGSANTITPAAAVQPAGSILQVVSSTYTTSTNNTTTKWATCRYGNYKTSIFHFHTVLQ